MKINGRMDAAVLLQKCPKSKRLIGIRVQKMEDGDWWRTWAFPLRDEVAMGEGYGSAMMHGNYYSTGEFPGCPDCGAMSFVKCNCGKIACWNGEKRMTCPWCGCDMHEIAPATEKFDVSGDMM